MRRALDIVESVEEERGLAKTYAVKSRMLLEGPQPALSAVPTGFLEEGMSRLLAKGLHLLPQSLESPRAG